MSLCLAHEARRPFLLIKTKLIKTSATKQIPTEKLRTFRVYSLSLIGQTHTLVNNEMIRETLPDQRTDNNTRRFGVDKKKQVKRASIYL